MMNSIHSAWETDFELENMIYVEIQDRFDSIFVFKIDWYFHFVWLQIV